MNRFEDLEKNLKKAGIRAFLPAQNITLINGIDTASVLFHSYTHADKAIPVLKDMGYKVLTGRERNIYNAYFKYYVGIQ